jgi:hypothetical protein
MILFFITIESKGSLLTWSKINQDRFDNINNILPRGIAIFNDKLIVGIGN